MKSRSWEILASICMLLAALVVSASGESICFECQVDNHGAHPGGVSGDQWAIDCWGRRNDPIIGTKLWTLQGVVSFANAVDLLLSAAVGKEQVHEVSRVVHGEEERLRVFEEIGFLQMPSGIGSPGAELVLALFGVLTTNEVWTSCRCCAGKRSDCRGTTQIPVLHVPSQVAGVQGEPISIEISAGIIGGGKILGIHAGPTRHGILSSTGVNGVRFEREVDTPYAPGQRSIARTFIYTPSDDCWMGFDRCRFTACAPNGESVALSTQIRVGLSGASSLRPATVSTVNGRPSRVMITASNTCLESVRSLEIEAHAVTADRRILITPGEESAQYDEEDGSVRWEFGVHPVRSTPGQYVLGTRLVLRDGSERRSTLTVNVLNQLPSVVPPVVRRSETAFVSAGGGGSTHILEPDWEQSYCLQATDPDGDELRFFVNRSPRHGRAGVIARGDAGDYDLHATYTASYDALLKAHRTHRPIVDSFTIRAEDPYGGRDEAKVYVSITVINLDPHAGSDHATTDQGIPVTIDVLANDADKDGDPVSLSTVGSAPHGSTSVAGLGVRYTPDPGFCGSDRFSYTIVDGYGGTATGMVTVTVRDTDPPTITIPGNVSGGSDPGVCGASISPGTATATDTCCSPTVVGVRSDGLGLSAPYPVGTTTIAWTATDGGGNTDTGTQTVTVTDQESPQLDGCPGPISTGASSRSCNRAVSWNAPTASDNCGMQSLVSSHSPGASFPADCSPTTVTYTATDVYGQTTSCSFPVTASESGAPSVNCPGTIQRVAYDPGGTSVSFSCGVSDGCDGNPSVSCSPSSGSTFSIGTTSVTCQATDDCGNTSSPCSFSVHVTLGNRPPEAKNDSRTMSGTSGTITISVLGNDSDPDGDPLRVIGVGQPSCGGTSIVGGTQVQYSTMGCTMVGQTVSFSYTISDGRGGEDSATVRVRLPDQHPTSPPPGG